MKNHPIFAAVKLPPNVFTKIWLANQTFQADKTGTYRISTDEK